jgi:hypothetical protein
MPTKTTRDRPEGGVEEGWGGREGGREGGWEGGREGGRGGEGERLDLASYQRLHHCLFRKYTWSGGIMIGDREKGRRWGKRGRD